MGEIIFGGLIVIGIGVLVMGILGSLIIITGYDHL
mgnify:CR=1 FL=1